MLGFYLYIYFLVFFFRASAYQFPLSFVFETEEVSGVLAPTFNISQNWKAGIRLIY